MTDSRIPTAELPDPLTPVDCDLKDFKFMPLDVARLRDSDMASEQTPEENWAAVLLWAASWHQVPAGSMPDSDNWIAKAAGYLSRGRIDPHWNEVRAGAMRGFILCSDGRWYHQVVAEKANESWAGKLKQRLKTECARIKKHNDRHGTKIPFPEFDAWFEAGCPTGQPLPVPKDITPPSLGTTDDVPDDAPPMSLDEVMGVPGETPSKGQGEGQRQGQLTSKPDTPPSTTTQTETGASSVGQLCIAMRAYGINADPGNMLMRKLADDGVTVETMRAACEEAKRSKPQEAISANYVVGIISRWAREAAALNATGAAPPQAHPQYRSTQAQAKDFADRLTGRNRHARTDHDDRIIDLNDRPAGKLG